MFPGRGLRCWFLDGGFVGQEVKPPTPVRETAPPTVAAAAGAGQNNKQVPAKAAQSPVREVGQNAWLFVPFGFIVLFVVGGSFCDFSFRVVETMCVFTLG